MVRILPFAILAIEHAKRWLHLFWTTLYCLFGARWGVMAALLKVVDIAQNVCYQAADDVVDDGDELSNKNQDGSASSPTALSSEDYVEERYKVDRRKLEQMIQGKHQGE